MAAAHLPDLILMDWRMPVMEGPEAIQRIKGNPATAHIPIVALTANAQPRDAARMKEVGAVSYLTKPIDLEQLPELFRRLKILPAAVGAG